MTLLTAPCTDVGRLYVGSQLFRSVTIVDEEGIPTDSTVTASMTQTGQAAMTGSVTHLGTGLYLITWQPFAARGLWSWRVTASGPVYAVEGGVVRVMAAP